MSPTHDPTAGTPSAGLTPLGLKRQAYAQAQAEAAVLALAQIDGPAIQALAALVAVHSEVNTGNVTWDDAFPAVFTTMGFTVPDDPDVRRLWVTLQLNACGNTLQTLLQARQVIS